MLTASEVGTAPNPQKMSVLTSIPKSTAFRHRPYSHRLDREPGIASILGSEMIINITPGTALGQR